MKRAVFFGLVSLIFLTGCSTMKSGSRQSLENRVGILETKVQVLEADIKAPSQASSETVVSTTGEIISSKSENGLTVGSMTKKDIQKALKNAGYYDGSIDGKIGAKTKAALKEFQKNMGLKTDGIAGKNTKEKLLKYL